MHESWPKGSKLKAGEASLKRDWNQTDALTLVIKFDLLRICRKLSKARW